MLGQVLEKLVHRRVDSRQLRLVVLELFDLWKGLGHLLGEGFMGRIRRHMLLSDTRGNAMLTKHGAGMPAISSIGENPAGENFRKTTRLQ